MSHDDTRDGAFVEAMVGLQTYHDKTICHARITGGGNRFNGFRTFKFGKASSILVQHQRNAVFRHTSNGIIEIETRAMTDRKTCIGVIDPGTLTSEPHNLTPRGATIHAGAVSKHTFDWTASISDTLLHKLSNHPYVLDVWIENCRLVVFIVHDRNIRGGLMDQVSKGKHRGCKKSRGQAGKSGNASRTSCDWKPLSRHAKGKLAARNG